MSRAKPIRAGQVWVTRTPKRATRKTRTPSRRVIAISDDGRICYSTGGDASRWCRVPAFRAWAKRYQAKATRTRRPRSLQLRDGGAR